MKFNAKTPPRAFEVGNTIRFNIYDCGDMHLEADEQITFRTESDAEYDVARKDWGFYATPSLNGRLPKFGLQAVLIRNFITGLYFIFLVEPDKQQSFEAYCVQENLEVVSWMNSSEALDELKNAMIKKQTDDN